MPFGNTLPIKVPDGPSDDRFFMLSDVLPTSWQAVEYAGIPKGGTMAVLGLGPIGDMSARIAKQQQLRMGQANVKRWVDDIMPLLFFVTHRLPLEQAPQAYADFQTKRDGVVKVVFTP